jgi:fluoride ion exporter CrcB/FEX
LVPSEKALTMVLCLFYVAGFVLMASLGAYFRFESAQFFIAPWGTLLVNVVGSLLIGFFSRLPGAL